MLSPVSDMPLFFSSVMDSATTLIGQRE